MHAGCCTLAQTVFNGACKPFVDAFRADADRALGESDQVFKQRVARAPVPTSACCVNARAYTQYNCACDNTLIATSPSKGYTPNQVRVAPLPSAAPSQAAEYPDKLFLIDQKTGGGNLRAYHDTIGL
ncbi:hypothetical protein CVIRNUC_006660 [Coccomyxa viridis]|uniref:Uncharacterized protein n=1 Tax=Coccomyxa viridis TaxID=1274662 RepID=A0AAV1I9B2_9CHLO|nr:hypothetical protein CVIRNUC_006660 [Coccomyxa viridis]